MSLPPIAPTGAMSSDEYCDYMIGYCNEAADQILSELPLYVAKGTIDDWEDLWDRTLDDVETSVTYLEESTKKINAQVTMARDAISKI
jgi:hypothetical protein